MCLWEASVLHGAARSSITVFWMLWETASVSVLLCLSHLIHQLYYPIGNTHTQTFFLFLLLCFFSFNVCRRLAVVTQQGWSDPPADLLVLFMKGSGWIIYGVHGYLANVLLTLSSLSARGQFVLAQQGSGLELMSGYSNLCWRAQVGVRSLRFLQRARARVCVSATLALKVAQADGRFVASGLWGRDVNMQQIIVINLRDAAALCSQIANTNFFFCF